MDKFEAMSKRIEQLESDLKELVEEVLTSSQKYSTRLAYKLNDEYGFDIEVE